MSEVHKQLNNHKSKVIDELNKRMEELEDNGELGMAEVLQDFYNWYVEEFMY